MTDHLDLSTRLDALSDSGRHAAKLDAPDAIRRRGKQRRLRRRVAQASGIVALAVLAAFVMIPDQDRGGTIINPSDNSTAPDETTPPSSQATVSEPLATPVRIERFLDGVRQLALLPVDTAYAISVDGEAVGSAVVVKTQLDPAADFVPVAVSPNSSEFLLKTGSLSIGGEPLCLAAVAGSEVVAAACDASDGDGVWRFDAPASSGSQLPSYLVRTRSGLTISSSGTTVQAVRGTGTPFHVADRGRARLPTLG